MNVDIYEDHMRFEGYHVPFDASKLPATVAERLRQTLQDSVDTADDGPDLSAVEAAADEATDDECERIMNLLEPRIEEVEGALEFNDAARTRSAVEKLRATFDGLEKS